MGEYMPDDFNSEFAQLVHIILILEQKWAVKDVAVEMGMNEHTFRSRFNGRTEFRPDEVRQLLKITPDERLIDFYLENTPYIAVKRADSASDTGRSSDHREIHIGASHTVTEASDILKAVIQALEDDKLDHNDRIKIKKEIDVAERAIASLRAMVS